MWSVLVRHSVETDVMRFRQDEASCWGRGQEMTRNEISPQTFGQIQKKDCVLCYFLRRVHFRVEVFFLDIEGKKVKKLFLFSGK